MHPTIAQADRLRAKLRLQTPLIAVYDAVPGPDFAPLVRATAPAWAPSGHPEVRQGARSARPCASARDVA